MNSNSIRKISPNTFTRRTLNVVDPANGDEGERDQKKQKLQRFCERAVFLSNEAMPLNQEGITKMDLGLVKEAEPYFIEALQNVETNPISLSKVLAEVDWQTNSFIVNTSDKCARIKPSYDEGMYVYCETLILSMEYQDQHRLSFARVVFNIAQTYISRGKFDVAKAWLEQALTKLTNSCMESEEKGDRVLTTLMVLSNIGFCWYRLNNNCEALAMYQQALIHATEFHLDPLHTARCNNAIAILMLHQEDELSSSDVRYKTITQLFESSLTIYIDKLGPNSCQTASILNNMGQVHFKNHQYEKALPFYHRALTIRRKQLDLSSVDLAVTMCNLGRTLQKTGQLTEALTVYEEYLSLQERYSGLDFGVCVIYSKVADLYHENGQLTKALAMYRKSLEICTQSSCGNITKSEQTILLNKLGSVSAELDMLVDSMSFFTAGLVMELLMYDIMHPQVMISLLNIAQIHRRLEDFPAAILKYQQVKQIQCQLNGPRSLQVAAAISSEAQMRYLQQDYNTSLELFQEALKIQRSHFGETNNLDIASTLSSIGVVLFNGGWQQQSKECFIESLRIRRVLHGKDHPNNAIHLYNLATVCLESGDDENAIQLYKETIRIEMLCKKYTDAILTLQYLGIIHQKRGELEEGLKCFEKALRFERQYGSADSNRTALAKLLNLIGNMHLQTGNVKGMMECYVEASSIYLELGPIDDTLVIAGFYFYFFHRLHPPSAPAA